MDVLTTDGNPWAAAPGAAPHWLRGSIHCHTSNSDGRITAQEAVSWFASAGYDFLALTDHNLVTDPAPLDAHGLCLLAATELTATGGELGASYHLIALGVDPRATLPATATPAPESVAWLRRQGAVVFVAHPHWSGLTVADLLAAGNAGAHGIEVYNGGTVLDSQKGEATVHWDEGLARGARWWGVAVDDTHWHTVDRGLGWVMVRAAEATPGHILAALARGHFYSSCGPEIHQVRLTPNGEDAYLEVEASPCAAIYALSYGARNQFHFDREAAARGEPGATITVASFRIERQRLGPGGYVRVQCTDWQRRSAWSNPLFLG
jgi:predicted metal-dependent phosphoesterase TrpH